MAAIDEEERLRLLAEVAQLHDAGQHQQIIARIERVNGHREDYVMAGLLARAYVNYADSSKSSFNQLHQTAVDLLAPFEQEGANDPMWNFRMGAALYWLDRLDEAMPRLRRACELDPADTAFAQLTEKCAQEIADKTTVIPVTTKTITEHLDSREATYAFHDDGAVCMMFPVGHYWFSVSPEDNNLSLLARIETPASLDLRPALVEVCNDWNSRTRWPKASVFVNDEGKAFVYAEMHLTLSGGMTRATVSTNIDRFVSTSQQFFTHVGERFPSLAYSPEE